MTSKTSFSKRAFYNAKERLWSFALTTLILFFMFPVAAAFIATQENNYRFNTDMSAEMMTYLHKVDMASAYTAMAGKGNMFYGFIFIGIAFVLAMSGFAYLYNQKQVDFYHELPVTRKELFFTNYIVGILFYVIPYTIMSIVGLAIIQLQTGGLVQLMPCLIGYVFHLAMFLMIYSLVILAIIMTGQLVVGFLGACILGIFGTALAGCFYFLADLFFITWYPNHATLGRTILRLSCFGTYISGMTGDGIAAELAIALVEAVVFTAIAVVLYRKRPLEAAGRAMSFRVTEPVIKFLTCFMAAVYGGILFYQIMENIFWGVFGLVSTLVIYGCIMEIIYRGDFRKLFDNFRVIVIAGIAAVTVITVYKADLFGYDSYSAKPDELESVGIQLFELSPETRWNYYADVKTDVRPVDHKVFVYFESLNSRERTAEFVADNQEAAMAIVNDGLKNTTEIRNSSYSTSNLMHKWTAEKSRVENENYYEAEFVYNLKNGQKVYRKMLVNTTKTSADMKALYNDLSYKKAIYPLLKLSKEDIAAVNYKEVGLLTHVEMVDSGMKDKLFETYCSELKALRAEDMEHMSPIAAIQFKTNDIQAIIDELRETGGDYSQFNEYFYYPIYPTFENTIALLKECGIEVGNSLKPENIKRIEMHYWGNNGEKAAEALFVPEEMDSDSDSVEVAADVPAEAGLLITPEETVNTSLSIAPEEGKSDKHVELLIDDKDQIREVMDAAFIGELGVSNPFMKLFDEIVIDVYFDGELEYRNKDYYDGKISYTISLDANRVPEFVKEYYSINDEMIQKCIVGGI